jgi:2,6-dihydroxypyridine 3-monooxygenase
MMADVEDNIQQVSLKPGAVWVENVTRLYQKAVNQLPELLSQLILNTKQPFIQAVLDCEVPHMAFGRVCLLGDAAAAGTAKAAEDGEQLSRARRREAGYQLQLGLWPIGVPLPFGCISSAIV